MPYFLNSFYLQCVHRYTCLPHGNSTNITYFTAKIGSVAIFKRFWEVYLVPVMDSCTKLLAMMGNDGIMICQQKHE